MKIKNILKQIEKYLLSFKRKKDIIVFIHNKIMYMHVKPYCELLQKDKRFRLWICFSIPELFKKKQKIEICKRLNAFSIPYFIAKYIFWDLAIYPDHNPWLWDEIKKVWISHGVSFLPKNNFELYDFIPNSTIRNDGEPFYNLMLIYTDRIKNEGIKLNPKLKNNIKVVGSLFYDMLYKYSKLIDVGTRKNNKKRVYVLSTWGKHSLLQHNWDTLESQIKINLDKFEFYLAIHPNNFIEKNSGGVNWSKILNEGLEKGYWQLINDIIMQLSTGWKPDIIITDHTSFHNYCLIYNVPILFLKFPNGPFNNEEKDSLMPKYEQLINEVISKYAHIVTDFNDLNNLIEIATNIHSTVNIKEAIEYFTTYLGNSDKYVYKEICNLLEINEMDIF